MNVSTPCRLTFRLARSGDFDAIVKLSEGIYDGHDYLPLKFHNWLQRDNLDVLLAYSGDKLVGLQACFVVDEGRTFIRRAERILAELRGQGLARQLSELQEITPESIIQMYNENASRQVMMHVLWIKQNFQSTICCHTVFKINFMVRLKYPRLERIAREYFSKVILSDPVRAQLFPDNIIVVNWCPFEPLRSNIDHMIQESDEFFVEKCADDGVLYQDRLVLGHFHRG